MSKYLYPIYKLKTKSYIKWWLYNYLGKFNYILSEILTGTEFYLEDTTDNKFNLFIPIGRTTQESTTGKNLFNEVQLLEATDWQVNNGVYSGTIDNWFSKFKSGFTGLSFETNTQYTISLKGYTTGGSPRIKIVYTDNTSSTLAISASSMTEYSITSTSGKTISSVQADFGSGSTQTLSLSEIQIEKGTSKTSWEKYTGGEAAPSPSYPFPIKNTGDNGYVNEKVQNKNLFDINNETFITRFNDSTATVVNNSLQIVKTIGGMQERVTVYKQLKPNTTYALSTGNTPQTGGFFGGYLAAVDSISSSAYPGSSEGLSATATTNSSGVLAVVFFVKSAFTGTLTISDIQLELGSTASTYITHAEQNISFPLAQGQKLMEGDYLADDGVHHVSNKIVLDGVSNYLKVSNVTYHSTSGLYYCALSLRNRGKDGITNLLSTHFRAIQGLGIGNCYITGGGYSLVFVLQNQEITTVEQANNWLASQYQNQSPVEFEYLLLNEVIEAYTSEQQTVWKQIKALKTYKPVTHISSEDETPAELKIQYYKER